MTEELAKQINSAVHAEYQQTIVNLTERGSQLASIVAGQRYELQALRAELMKLKEPDNVVPIKEPA